MREIRTVWWACLGTLFIYSIVAIALGGLPLGEGLSALDDPFNLSVFLTIFLSTLVIVALPFSLFGRKYVQRSKDPKQVVASAILRIALAEVATILGIAVLVVTKSYELYLTFLLLSIVALLLLRGEERFYEHLLPPKKVEDIDSDSRPSEVL